MLANVVSSEWNLSAIDKSATVKRKWEDAEQEDGHGYVQKWCATCACFRSQIYVSRSGTDFVGIRTLPQMNGEETPSTTWFCQCPSPHRYVQQLAQSTATCGVHLPQPLQVRLIHSQITLSFIPSHTF